MGVEVGPAPQSPLTVSREVRRRDRLVREDQARLRPVIDSLSCRLSAVSRQLPEPLSLERQDCQKREIEPDGDLGKATVEHVEIASSPDSQVFTFGLAKPKARAALDFIPETLYPARQSLKRCRHSQDVDGPNTAGVCRKKRRIRADLITSRLSQPYSQPATHILNREGIKSGDKRFLKMATSLDTAKRIMHLQATSFLRFSVMNRLRKRMGIGRPDVQAHERRVDEMDTTSKAPWQPSSSQDTPSGRYIRPSMSRDAADSPMPAGRPSSSGKDQPPQHQGPILHLSRPAGLPLPSGDLAALRTRPSPRIIVRSPELRPHSYYDDLEEDSFGFLHVDEESDGTGADESEHVYSDFGVIFGGGPATGQDAQEDHTYEEYLDELDGISWQMR